MHNVALNEQYTCLINKTKNW